MTDTILYFSGLLLLVGIFIGLMGIMESRQTIYSLIWLVYIFIGSALFFIVNGADFIGLVITIVYIGAIAMLFLYTTMLLDPRYLQVQKPRFSDAIKSFMLLYFISTLPWAPNTLMDLIDDHYDYYWLEHGIMIENNNIYAIAYFLYDKYSWLLVIIGFFLLMGMIIAVDLASFHKSIKKNKH